MIDIKFRDGAVCTLREPKRAEIALGLEIAERTAGDPSPQELRELRERTEPALLAMVVEVTTPEGGKLTGEDAQKHAQEEGWFMASCLYYMNRIAFLFGGELVTRNGDLGLSSMAVRQAASGQAILSAQVLDA